VQFDEQKRSSAKFPGKPTGTPGANLLSAFLRFWDLRFWDFDHGSLFISANEFSDVGAGVLARAFTKRQSSPHQFPII